MSFLVYYEQVRWDGPTSRYTTVLARCELQSDYTTLETFTRAAVKAGGVWVAPDNLIPWHQVRQIVSVTD